MNRYVSALLILFSLNCHFRGRTLIIGLCVHLQCGHFTLPPPLTKRNVKLDIIVTEEWTWIFVSLGADLPSKPPRTQGVAGSILISATEICAFFVLS